MIDTTIFDNLEPDVEQLISSGFAYEKDGSWFGETPVAGGLFQFNLRINPDGSIWTEVIDLETGEQYLPYNVKDATGAFIGELNEECQRVAQRFADGCFRKPGRGEQVEQVSTYMFSQYGSVPEHLWPDKYPDYVVWRRNDNEKWIGILMQIPASKLSIDSDRILQILDIHATADMIASIDQRTIFPAYHMNKKHWITLILDGRMTFEAIQGMIDTSYTLAK